MDQHIKYVNCILSIAFVCCSIIQLCKHVVAKVTLVPCSVNLTGKRDKVGHGEVTINNARIILIADKITKNTLLQKELF